MGWHGENAPGINQQWWCGTTEGIAVYSEWGRITGMAAERRRTIEVPDLPRLRRRRHISFRRNADMRGLDTFHPASREKRAVMQIRATDAANTLIQATARGSVAIIGHGWFNRVIGEVLARNGWRIAETHSSAHHLGRVASPWGFKRPYLLSREAEQAVVVRAILWLRINAIECSAERHDDVRP